MRSVMVTMPTSLLPETMGGGAVGEDFYGLSHGAGFSQRDRIFLHEQLQSQGVIESGIDSSLVCSKSVAKADVQNGPSRNDADELVGIDDGEVMAAVIAEGGGGLWRWDRCVSGMVMKRGGGG